MRSGRSGLDDSHVVHRSHSGEEKEAAEATAAGGIADLHWMAAWEILYTLKLAIELN